MVKPIGGGQVGPRTLMVYEDWPILRIQPCTRTTWHIVNSVRGGQVGPSTHTVYEEWVQSGPRTLFSYGEIH